VKVQERGRGKRLRTANKFYESNFSRHYDEALQRTPDVVFAQAAVAKLLRTQAGGK